MSRDHPKTEKARSAVALSPENNYTTSSPLRKGKLDFLRFVLPTWRMVSTQNGETRFLTPRKCALRSTPLDLRISYLWPECVIRAMMSRRLSVTVALAKSSRSAGLILPNVALMAVAHLSMPSALG